jgi:hypothetical protein
MSIKVTRRVADADMVLTANDPNTEIIVEQLGEVVDGVRYWRGYGDGITGFVSDAHHYAVSDIPRIRSLAGPRASLTYLFFEYVPDPPAVPVEKPKPTIDMFFPLQFIELIRSHPKNPLLRGHIMKRLLKMPPAECDTFDKLVEWITTNCTPPKNTTLQQMGQTARVRQRPAEEPSVNIDFDVSRTEIGRCDYTVNVSGSGCLGVRLSKLTELIDDYEIESIDELIDRLECVVREDDETNGVLGDYGDCEYSDHDCTDTDNHEVSIINRRSLGTAVLEMLSQHAPEHHRRLTE